MTDELNTNPVEENEETLPVMETPQAEVAEVEEAAAIVEVEEKPIPKVEKPVEKPIESIEFDWNAIGKKQDLYSSVERDRLEKLYDETFNSITEQEVVEGTIVAINPREVVVNIGFKSDGVIPFSELRYNTNLKINDKIEVYIESQEDSTGQLLLSHKKAKILRSWERVNEVFEKQEVVNGYVK